MSYVDYLWLKVIVFGIAALIWGGYCGWTGRELNGRKRSAQPAQKDPRAPGSDLQ